MKKCMGIVLTLVMMVMGACGAETPAAQSDSSEASAMTESDLVFTVGGETFALNSDVVPLLEALGGDYVETTAPSCVYDGEDKQYDFAFASVFTYPLDGKDLIDEFYFFGGGYETSKGIGIGSTKTEVINAYGEGTQVGSSYVYALSGDGNDLKSPQLFFDMEEETVTAISFYAASNVAE